MGELTKKERENINTVAIIRWATENKIDYKRIATYQIRLISGEKKFDIFPQSKKYHNITENKRGVIQGRIIDFLSMHFPPPSNMVVPIRHNVRYLKCNETIPTPKMRLKVKWNRHKKH